LQSSYILITEWTQSSFIDSLIALKLLFPIEKYVESFIFKVYLKYHFFKII